MVSREYALQFPPSHQYAYRINTNVEEVYQNHKENYHGPCVLEFHFADHVEYHELVHDLE